MEQTKSRSFLKKPGWLHRPTRSDLILMIASLCIAALIWAYIASQTGYSLKFSNIPVVVDTTDTKAGGYRLTVLSPASGELTVNAELSGSRTEIGGLSKSDLEAYIDFDTGVTDTIGNQTLPIRLRRKNGQVFRNAVLSVNTADVQMDKIRQIELAVAVSETVCPNIEGADGETFIDRDNIEIEPKTITVSGPSTTLQQLDHIRVRLNDSERLSQKKAFTGCGDFDLIGTDGNAVSKSAFKVQAQFDVTVPVYYLKKLPVTLTLSNVPPGFDEDWLLQKLRLKTDREYRLEQFCENDDEKLFITIETREQANKESLDERGVLAIGPLDLYEIGLGGKRKQVDIKMQEGNINRSNIDTVSVSLDESGLSENSFLIANNDISVLNSKAGCVIDAGYTEIRITGDADEIEEIMASVSDIRASVDLLTATIPKEGPFLQLLQVALPETATHVWFSPAPKASFTATAVSPTTVRRP